MRKATTTDRPARYVSGVVVPPRVAHLLEQQLDLRELRLTVQGSDPDAYETLAAIRWAALEWAAISERNRAAKSAPERAKSSEAAAPSKDRISVMGAAARLRLSCRRVQQLAAAGQFDAERVNGRWSLNRTAVDNYRKAS